MNYKNANMRNFSEVNQPYECLILLDELNNLITTLSKLSDSNYYMDYIFNASTITLEHLKEIGINKDYILETLDKFEKLRHALFGNTIDWKGLVQQEMKNIAKAEREKNKINENYIRKLEYQLSTFKKNNQ